MNKTAIIDFLNLKHRELIKFMEELTTVEFATNRNGKWSSGQHLSHILLCVAPLAQFFAADKKQLELKFGTVNRPGRDYDEMVEEYQKKIGEGGKSPEKFVPGGVLSTDREALIKDLKKALSDLSKAIETFTEDELDTLMIPHPLLASITLREMLYNAAYHAEHHRLAAMKVLASSNEKAFLN